MAGRRGRLESPRTHGCSVLKSSAQFRADNNAAASGRTEGKSMLKGMVKVVVVAVVAMVSATAMAASQRGFDRPPRAGTGVVNINTASVKELELLPGVGKKTAALIVAYREKQQFKAPGEIVRVKGIGDGIFKKIKPYVVTSGQTTLQVVPRGKGEGASTAATAAPTSAPVGG